MVRSQGRCQGGAFLQGQRSEEKRKVYAWPVEELAEALNMPRGQPAQLLKACYGLVNAPAEWFNSVCLAMTRQDSPNWSQNPACGESWNGLRKLSPGKWLVYVQHTWTISSSQEMIEAQHGAGQSLKSMTVFFGHPGK